MVVQNNSKKHLSKKNYMHMKW